MRKTHQPASYSVDISEEAGIRYLHFGSDWVQGAMRIARPYALELAYTREMMAGLLFRQNKHWPRSVLQIGLGAGSLSKFIYRNLPESRMTVIEINPQVETVARQYFNLPDDPLRLDVIIADGADYILQGGRQFDYILLDGFDADAKAGILDTLPFYQACRTRLTDCGLLAVNLLGRNRGFQDSLARISDAFDQRARALPSCDSGNTIAFACAGDPVRISLDQMRERALQMKTESGLDLFPTLNRLQNSAALTDSILCI